MGITDADHEETAPDAPALLISRLARSLAGVSQRITLAAGSRAAGLYGQREAIEQFTCSYGLNPLFRETVGRGPLRITGVDDQGEVRIVELPDHPFFMTTLFQPQLSSKPGGPHPLVVAFLKAAEERRRRR